MSFAAVLNQLMKDSNTSNLALGKAIGVSDTAIIKWKRGEASPSLDNAIAIAKFYEISLDQLVGDKQSLEPNGMTLLPIAGILNHDLICYGLPSGKFAYATQKDIDGYSKNECYAITAKHKLFFVHQQSMCENGDIIIYKLTDFISEYGIPFAVYGMKKYIRKDDYIELASLYPNEASIYYRKQEINQLHIVGIVINQSDTTAE